MESREARGILLPKDNPRLDFKSFQAGLYSNMYKRQLNDILDSYEKTLQLINQKHDNK